MSDRKKALLPLLVLALGLVAVFVLVAGRPEVAKVAPEIVPPTVRFLTVQPERRRVEVASQGTVVPRTESELVAEVSGTIVRTATEFESGGFVRAGQPLVWIDPRDYQANVASQRATLAQAQVLLQREQAEAEVAEREWTALGRTEKANPLVLRQPQLQEAQARIEAVEAALSRADLDLERAVLRAPFTGRVRTTSVDRGEFVARGTPVATLYSVDRAEIRLPVPDRDLAFLDSVDGFSSNAEGLRRKDGPIVTLSAEFAGEMRQWRGHIVRSEGEIDPATRMVMLVAQVEDPYALSEDVTAPLTVGLFVDAAIEGRVLDGVFTVPRIALRRDGVVMVVEGDRLAAREVHVLRAGADSLIIDRGLESGDRVVVSNLDVATEGMQVTPVPADQIDATGSTVTDGIEPTITDDALEEAEILGGDVR